jgi:catecholate siderophore receptor
MDLDAAYAQSDYNAKHRWLGREHNLSAGVDAARESFQNFALAPPTGTTIVKPPTTVGTPADGARVDESLRIATMNRSFEAKALGVYAQDLLQIAPMWKLLGGLRWDKFSGSYHAITAQGQPTNGTPPVANPCYVPADTRYSRSDSLFSHRAGVLFQPTEQQSYHLAYGTSFNTSGDAYQFDAGTARTDPESSRNVELGTKLDLAGGRLSVRGALFHSTKFNERNRDAESVNACNYVLSGKRHSAGLELDLAGRISAAWEVFGSYAYIPVAKVDASSGAAGTEVVGLTPRHSGTVWSTYRVTSAWRLGAGLNARSGDRPVGLAATSTTSAPRFVTADLMAEYTLQELSLKVNLSNVTNSHYADTLYRGHYVAGKARSLQTTVAYKF